MKGNDVWGKERDGVRVLTCLYDRIGDGEKVSL